MQSINNRVIAAGSCYVYCKIWHQTATILPEIWMIFDRLIDCQSSISAGQECFIAWYTFWSNDCLLRSLGRLVCGWEFPLKLWPLFDRWQFRSFSILLRSFCLMLLLNRERTLDLLHNIPYPYLGSWEQFIEFFPVVLSTRCEHQQRKIIWKRFFFSATGTRLYLNRNLKVFFHTKTCLNYRCNIFVVVEVFGPHLYCILTLFKQFTFIMIKFWSK